MAEPRILLLDEPMAGVSPSLRVELLEHILDLRRARRHHAPDRRARPRLRHARQRPRDRDERRPRDRAGHAGRGAPRRAAWSTRTSARSHERRDACSRSTRSRPATATRSSCTASRCAADAHEIVAVIGPNGAGKSTLLKAVYGLVHAARRARCASTGEDVTGVRGRPADPARAQLRAADRQRLPDADRRRERPRRLARRAEDASATRRVERVRELFPILRERAAPARRHALGRPAQAASRSRGRS